MIDWTDAIEHLVRVKRLAEEYDRAGLARFASPPLPADPEQLRSAIDCRVGALDDQYVEFLRHADGWPGLLHSFGLFGTSELLGEEFDGALELISYLEPDILPDAGVVEEDLFPIGWSPVTIDVFVTVTSAPEPRPVIWFAGLEVERFETFEAFFRYMTDKNVELTGSLRNETAGE